MHVNQPASAGFRCKSTRILIVMGLLASTVSAYATTIEYTATDIADVTPGEDLWQYDYSIAGRNFVQAQFFDIYFDPALYGTLLSGPAPNPDWDVLILQQPAPANIPPFDTGIFDAFALGDGASLAGSFSVVFAYLGTGTPGAQPFTIFDTDGTQLETGFTRAPGGAPVPEPATGAMSLPGLGLGMVLWLRSVTVAARNRSMHS